MWDKTIFDVGQVAPETTLHATFIFYGIAENLTYKLSCGCSDASWDQNTQTFAVNVRTGKIPVHLTEYVLEKFATVYYTVNNEEKTETLIVKGLVRYFQK